MSMIEVEDLRIVYNKKVAVDGISFSVEAGEVLGILGRNGAGKSSTLKVLGGVFNHTSGRVSIDGHTRDGFVEDERVRSVTGYCPDVGGLIPQATLREHIGLCLALHNRPDLEDAAYALVELFDMTKDIDREVRGFSHGMSRRVSTMLAVISSQKALILDEPFDGVDPLGEASIKTVLDMAREAGVATIISTHQQELMTELCDRIIVMSKGRILGELPAEQLRGKEGVQLYNKMLLEAEYGPKGKKPEVTAK